MKLVVYRDIVKYLLSFSSNKADIKKIQDWQTASSLVGSMNSLSDKEELKKFDSRISSINTIQYRDAVKQRFGRASKINKR